MSKELLAIVMRGNWNQLTEDSNERIVLRVDRFVLLGRHPNTGDDQKGTENVDNPVESGDQNTASADHGAAHQEGAEDTPEEDSVLVFPLHAKVAEEQDKDENIVD